MSDQVVQPDRLQFYNTFGHHVVSSAIEAIDDSVEHLTGSRCAQSLREQIESIIVAAWNQHSESMEATFKSGIPTLICGSGLYVLLREFATPSPIQSAKM